MTINARQLRRLTTLTVLVLLALSVGPCVLSWLFRGDPWWWHYTPETVGFCIALALLPFYLSAAPRWIRDGSRGTSRRVPQPDPLLMKLINIMSILVLVVGASTSLVGWSVYGDRTAWPSHPLGWVVFGCSLVVAVWVVWRYLRHQSGLLAERRKVDAALDAQLDALGQAYINHTPPAAPGSSDEKDGE